MLGWLGCAGLGWAGLELLGVGLGAGWGWLGSSWVAGRVARLGLGLGCLETEIGLIEN